MLITYVHMSIILLFHVHITCFLFYLSLNLFTCSSGGFILVHSSNESNTLDSRNFFHRISEGKTTSCKDRLLKAEVDLLPLQKKLHTSGLCLFWFLRIDWFLSILKFLNILCHKFFIVSGTLFLYRYLLIIFNNFDISAWKASCARTLIITWVPEFVRLQNALPNTRQWAFSTTCIFSAIFIRVTPKKDNIHCVKSARIRSFSGLYFPTLGLNTEKYSVFLTIQTECGKIRTSKNPNTSTFQAGILV